MTRVLPVFHEHPIPTAASKPDIVANGPDRAIWFCESGPDQIGRLDPNSGAITGFALPNPACAPIGIVTGADGALWFTESKGHKVGRLSTTGDVHEVDLPTPQAGPNGIVLGPDGNVWFAEHVAGKVARIGLAGGNAWFQLYMRRDEAIGLDLIDRAEACGIGTLVVTADVPLASAGATCATVSACPSE